MKVDFQACSFDWGTFDPDGSGEDITRFNGIQFEEDGAGEIENVHLTCGAYVARELRGDMCDEFLRLYDEHKEHNGWDE